MKGKTGPPAEHLRPILDTYMGAAVALVGCTSRGMQRYSCEFDVIVVAGERRPKASLRFGDVYSDVAFMTEKEVLKPPNPERALSIALSRPVRDNSLILSTGSATALATFSDSARSASRIRLTSALKSIVRAEDSASKGHLLDSEFWLLAATYEYAYALLLAREAVPSPSHLLSQLRSVTKAPPRGFEGVSMGAGLADSTRAGCGARLEGVLVLHDLLREGSGSEAGEEWSEVRSEIMGAKAKELVTRVELAECYSFLGQELVDALVAVLKRHPKKTISSLAAEGTGLIGERLVRQLGLVRDGKGVKEGLGALKQQVSVLAKRL